VGDLAPGRRPRLEGRVDRGVDDQAVALVVVRASPILREIEGIDRRAEEELADVVHGLRERVADPVVAPARGPLEEGYVHPVIGGAGAWRVLAVVGIGGDGPAPIVRPGRDAGGNVLI